MKKPFIALATLTLGLTFGALMTLPAAALDGTARDTGEAEVVCTEEGDEDCAAEVETTEEEPAEDCELDKDGNCVEAEPETWPMILSFAAIGVTVIITIILAIAGRGRK